MLITLLFRMGGTEKSVSYHKSMLRSAIEWVERHPECEEAAANLEAMQEYAYASDHPVMIPHEATSNELYALEHLRDTNCAYTPHLLEFQRDIIDQTFGFDLAVEGGYVYFILMTKVPGKRIDREEYWKLDPSKREQIKEAFKVAWTYVIPLDDLNG